MSALNVRALTVPARLDDVSFSLRPRTLTWCSGESLASMPAWRSVSAETTSTQR